ncbi:hypothetical protein [Kribbella sp. HUAS MG21]|uniref:PIN domain-containing protein n=1 Tax=Kribbella sp. HUAS MG21 TaxID=3160966 RepID=A0AAU7TLP3_9ACTN
MPTSPAHDSHVVVFDVNVFLDVASLLGPRFEATALSSASAVHIGSACPHPTDSRIDSLRALTVCTSGRFVGPQPLQVWTSSHIDHLIVHKLTQPIDGPTPELAGFGWTEAEADEFLDRLVYGLVFDMSKGGTVGDVPIPSGSPPLSHEDGCVFRTAAEAGDPTESRLLKYCVTNDRQFRKAEPNLSSEVLILYPSEWVQLVRKARIVAAMGKMKPIK